MGRGGAQGGEFGVDGGVGGGEEVGCVEDCVEFGCAGGEGKVGVSGEGALG